MNPTLTKLKCNNKTNELKLHEYAFVVVLLDVAKREASTLSLRPRRCDRHMVVQLLIVLEHSSKVQPEHRFQLSFGKAYNHINL